MARSGAQAASWTGFFFSSHPFLILFSSFSKDVSLFRNPKLEGMTEKANDGTELIVTGFGDNQTAFLARAALARMQDDLGIASSDAVLVFRESDGSIAVQQASNRRVGKNERSVFWETLTDLLFDPEPESVTNTATKADNCATLGIEPAFITGAEQSLRHCESAILLLTRDQAQREKAAGMLKGFVRSIYHSWIRLGRENSV